MATNTNPFYTYSATAGSSKTLQKPQDGGDNNQWGNYINTDLDEIVSAVNALSDKIADANEKTLVDFTATGSAVNHVGITNAAAGNGPTISAAGSESNVDLNVTAKGTGNIKVNNSQVVVTDSGTSGNIPTVRLNSTEVNVGDGDVLGQIDFKSADSGRSGDPAAAIKAVCSEGDGSHTDLTFSTGEDSAAASEKMRIDSSGNVGIATSGDIKNKFQVQVGTDHRIGFFGTSTYSGIQSANDANDANKALRFDATTYDFKRAGGTTNLFMDASGNVGIGTDSPTSDGGTTLEIYNANTPTLRLNDGGEYKALVQLRGNDTEIRGSNGNIEFYTGNADGASSTERMRISPSGSITTPNGSLDATFNGEIGSSATFASALFNKSQSGYVILPSGIEIKWGLTSSISSFADGSQTTHTYTSDQGGAFANATLWGLAWVADRTTCPNITGGSNGTYDTDNNAASITIHGGTGSTASNVRLGFIAIGH